MAALVWVCLRVLPVNSTTVALAMLILVLGSATRWGLGEATFTSLACVVCLNYFFLPPVGTFTIADPENWVALFAFLLSAVVVSKLSAQAKTRAAEASARGGELERLYRLSRAMLMDETSDLVRTALVAASEIFGLRHIAFYDSQAMRVYGSTEEPLLREAELARVASTEEPSVGPRAALIPVRLGTRVIGGLGLIGRELTEPERDSIANLIAISYERARVLERATAAEAARRGEKLKTSLLDGIAHSLKTPLSAIKTCVTTLITIPPQSMDARKELLSIIDEETDRLQRTITEAIRLAGIESGKIALDRRTVRLRDVVERVLAGGAMAANIRVSVPEDLSVEADESLLEQAMVQMVENAGKYAGAGKGIEIGARREEGGVVFEVMDRGPGISPHELDRVFEKYFRGTRGRGAVEGTGIGLSVARGVIEAHGGRIWAENRVGGGAAFRFRLPTR